MDQKPTTVSEVASNCFARLLSEFRDGLSVAELSDAQQLCVAAARDTNKAATLRYTMTFTPSGNAIVVTDKIETKLPAEDREKAIFFPTEDNTLSRQNPAQKELNLREVQKPTPAIKEVQASRAVLAS